jgi:hypothetical protein
LIVRLDLSVEQVKRIRYALAQVVNALPGSDCAADGPQDLKAYKGALSEVDRYIQENPGHFAHGIIRPKVAPNR